MEALPFPHESLYPFFYNIYFISDSEIMLKILSAFKIPLRYFHIVKKNFLSHTVKFDYGKSHNTLHSSAFYLHICVSYQSYLTITFCEDITLRPVNLISITIGASLFYVVKLIRISQDIGK